MKPFNGMDIGYGTEQRVQRQQLCFAVATLVNTPCFPAVFEWFLPFNNVCADHIPIQHPDKCVDPIFSTQTILDAAPQTLQGEKFHINSFPT